MESAPTANNVILIHTVGVDVLDDPLQRDVAFVPNGPSGRSVPTRLDMSEGSQKAPNRREVLCSKIYNLLM